MQIHANTCIYGRKYCNTAFQYMILTCQYPIDTCQYPIDTGMYYVSICKYFCQYLQVFLSRYVEIDQVVFDKNTYAILTNRFTDDVHTYVLIYERVHTMYIHIHEFMNMYKHVQTCMYYDQTRTYRFAISCLGG